MRTGDETLLYASLDQVLHVMTGRSPLDPAAFDDASTVLLAAPEVKEPIEDAFAHLLASLESTPDRVVGVTMAKPARDFIDPWRRALDGEETTFSFVSTAGVARSLAAGAATADPSPPGASVTRLEDPRPLSAFHDAVSDHLDDATEETMVCFHSLTHLLEFVDPETAFRFLHAHLAHVRSLDGRGIYHIDDAIHDEETIIQLSTLFDLVVQPDGPGDLHHEP